MLFKGTAVGDVLEEAWLGPTEGNKAAKGLGSDVVELNVVGAFSALGSTLWLDAGASLGWTVGEKVGFGVGLEVGITVAVSLG